MGEGWMKVWRGVLEGRRRDDRRSRWKLKMKMALKEGDGDGDGCC